MPLLGQDSLSVVLFCMFVMHQALWRFTPEGGAVYPPPSVWFLLVFAHSKIYSEEIGYRAII